MSDRVEGYLEFVCIILKCLIEFVSYKEFVSRIASCLIELRVISSLIREL